MCQILIKLTPLFTLCAQLIFEISATREVVKLATKNTQRVVVELQQQSTNSFKIQTQESCNMSFKDKFIQVAAETILRRKIKALFHILHTFLQLKLYCRKKSATNRLHSIIVMIKV